MTDPKEISINSFSYELPADRIASHPLPSRDDSKLLIYDQGIIAEDIYQHIDKYIPPGSLLVFNNSRVIAARILFSKPTGGVIEIFCLEPHEIYKSVENAMSQKDSVYWQCLIGGASKWSRGDRLIKQIEQEGNTIHLHARYAEQRSDCFIIEFTWSPSTLSFAEVLSLAGLVPLPPYIKRDPVEEDKIRYQTIYARQDGSVAAPTAGLHFTPAVFDKLENKGIKKLFLTLHVGAGTFKPVSTPTIGDHEMHGETISISQATLSAIMDGLDNKVVAVGTTSLRTIETLYWLGVKSLRYKSIYLNQLFLSQWEAYELEDKLIPPKDALQALYDKMSAEKVVEFITRTSLMILPGYRFRIVHGLVTNFHQPKSTLLLLVAAFIGEDLPTGQAGWKKVYAYALENDFRFLSYGDGSLLWLADGG